MKILNRWNLKVIFECVDLVGADLRGADLRGAGLRDVDLRGANLVGANLIDADLRGANLRGANLIGANLIGADLRDVNLVDANLRDANLRDADLRGADLIQISLPFFQVVVQKTHTRIGCKYFENKDWKNFSDVEIEKMDSNAMEFWSRYKQIIFSAIDSLNKEKTR